MGIISSQSYSLIIGSAIITMLLTPLFMGVVSRWYPKLTFASKGLGFAKDAASVAHPELINDANVVVVAGCGRVG